MPGENAKLRQPEDRPRSANSGSCGNVLELAAEAVDPTAVALRWAARRGGSEVQAGFAFFSEFAASFRLASVSR